MIFQIFVHGLNALLWALYNQQILLTIKTNLFF